MTEQEVSDEQAPSEGALSRPERIGWLVGVALFWLLAVGFVGASTRSVVRQVFGSADDLSQDRSAACAQALGQAAEQLGTRREPPNDVATLGWVGQWSDEVIRLKAACGDQDPTVIQLSVALSRLERELSQQAASTDHEHARLLRILQRYDNGRASP